MIIRNATAADINDIAKLYITNWKKTYKGLLSNDYLEKLDIPYGIHKWQEYLLLPDHRIFVAYEDTDLMGFVAGKIEEKIADCWYLDSLHVSEKARKRGIGTQLIQKIGGFAHSNGYKKMSICIVRGNDNAKKLYVDLGAEHYEFLVDDFTGTKSESEKLIWKDLSCFR